MIIILNDSNDNNEQNDNSSDDDNPPKDNVVYLSKKELFSFFRWDLMPIRAFMLALLCVGITRIYFWVYKSFKAKKFLDLEIFKRET